MFFSSGLDSPLVRMVLRLSEAAQSLSDHCRQELLDYLWARQTIDGGFRGRRGEIGDLYYTSFALRTLALINPFAESTEVDGFPKNRYQRIRTFLEGTFESLDSVSSVDFLSGIACAQTLSLGIDHFFGTEGDSNRWSELVSLFSERALSWRCNDGLFARSVEGAKRNQSSLYQTFLVLSESVIWGDSTVEQLFPHPDLTFQSVLNRQNREDGGFADLKILPHSGANPTAAAWGILQTLRGRLSTELPPTDFEFWARIGSSIGRFLISLRLPDGGFCAHAAIPFADLLSTFTALITLQEIAETLAPFGEEPKSQGKSQDESQAFVQSCRKPDGGYGASPWDTDSDLEYTFYSLIARRDS